MVTRKTGLREFSLRRPVNLEPERSTQEDIDVVHASLQTFELIALADDYDGGNDPYNSTGQHAALGVKEKN